MSTLREEFEAWHGATRAMFAKSGRHGVYMNSIIQSQWLAYQAATERAAKKALDDAYNAMFDLRGDKVTRFDAQTAIRKLKDAAAIRSGGEAGS